MRVLLINLEKTWRGGERQIEVLASYLQEKGEEVHIAYPKHSEGIHKYAQNFSVLPIPTRSLLDPRNIISLLNYVKKHNIQIIHANSSKSHGLSLFLKRLVPNIKLVVHRRIDGQISKRPSTRLKYLSNKIDSFVAISNSVKQSLVASGVDSNKIVLIPSGIDIHSFKESKTEAKTNFAKKYRLDANKTWVGIAAAMTKEKGVDDFIMAAKVALQMNPNLEFLIAGEGKNLQEYKKLVREQNFTDQIHFLGQLEPIHDFMRSIDVFFMPSKTEGLGTAFLHAMQAETLLIGTNTGGIPDIIEHNKTGYLIEVGDVDAASFLLAKYDPERAKQMTDTAKKVFLEKFTAEKMAEGNYQNYQTLLQ